MYNYWEQREKKWKIVFKWILNCGGEESLGEILVIFHFSDTLLYTETDSYWKDVADNFSAIKQQDGNVSFSGYKLYRRKKTIIWVLNEINHIYFCISFSFLCFTHIIMIITLIRFEYYIPFCNFASKKKLNMPSWYNEHWLIYCFQLNCVISNHLKLIRLTLVYGFWFDDSNFIVRMNIII